MLKLQLHNICEVALPASAGAVAVGSDHAASEDIIIVLFIVLCQMLTSFLQYEAGSQIGGPKKASE